MIGYKKRRGEEGQSLLLISLGMVVFLAMIAVVLDSGNDYVQKRQLQNSTDSGAQAGALKLAVGGGTNSDVNSAVNKFLVSNGTSVSGSHSYYIVRDGEGTNIVVRDTTILGYGGSNPAPTALNVNGTSLPVVGVQVEASRLFNTFFAGVVGFPQLTVSGGSAAYFNRGACSATGIWPLTMPMSMFMQNGSPSVHYEDVDPSYTYNMYEKNDGDTFAPGNFGWLTWDTPPSNDSPSNTTLIDNLLHPYNSGTIKAGDDIQGSTGNMTSSGVRDAVLSYLNTNTSVIIPIFDAVAGTGTNARYNIVAFARFHVTAIDVQGNPKVISGKFQEWVDPKDEGGCANFGVSAIKLRPPLNNSRSIVGAVKIQKLTSLALTGGTSHVPVDVMNVIDISSSMNDKFGSKTKIEAVRSEVKSFIDSMQPSLGDQVGLTVFPLNNGLGYTQGSDYNYSCTQNGSTRNYYAGQVLSNLTTSTNGFNSLLAGLNPAGYSPASSGLALARQAVLNAAHRAGNLPVVVIVSDGAANVRNTGQWTGFNNGNTTPSCNSFADRDTALEANIAKADGNRDGKPDAIIYTIALGNDFDPSLLQALATKDSDGTRPHFFTANSAGALQGVYQKIANQIQTIQQDCLVIAADAYAPNATVSVKYPDGSTHNLTTDAAGEFTIPNADSGTYQVTGAAVTVNGLTYNTATNGVGGAVTSWPLSVQVDSVIAPHLTEVDLATAGTISCGQ